MSEPIDAFRLARSNYASMESSGRDAQSECLNCIHELRSSKLYIISAV